MVSPLKIEGLHVAYGGGSDVLRGVDLALAPGESYGLVGESGCGKSTVAFAIQGHLDGGRVTAGRIEVGGEDVASMAEPALRRLRGSAMAMVYQDPLRALNPTMRIGRQLAEAARLGGAGRDGILKVLRRVRIPDPASLLGRWPHQLSGGQAQRVVIAMALLAQPKLLVLDEPTTGLDVTVAAEVVDLVSEIAAEGQAALLYISHDLGLIAKVAGRIGVMYAGRLVEEGPTRAVLRTPAHPYTRALLSCRPGPPQGPRGAPLVPISGQVPPFHALPPGCTFGPRCAFFVPGDCDRSPEPGTENAGPGHLVRCRRIAALPPFESRLGAAGARPDQEQLTLERQTRGRGGEEGAPILDLEKLSRTFGGGWLSSGPAVRASHEVSFTLRGGETLALVGESGSGKSTLARILVGLDTADAGEAWLARTNVAQLPAGKRGRELVRRLQIVFQNPDGTLNPAHRIGRILTRALRRAGRPHDRADVAELLRLVRLPTETLLRRPAELSGGQRQRVAIARAFAGAPDLVIADEPTSALDVSVQAAIVALLEEMRRQRGAAILFISHDLALVRHVADRVVVLYRGQVMEQGPVDEVFSGPHHPYTQALLAAVHPADPDHEAMPLGVPKGLDQPEERGCAFYSRCHRRMEVCQTAEPPVREEGRHGLLCHHDFIALAQPPRREGAAP